MNAIEAGFFIEREMRTRWPDWQPTTQESADWVRRLEPFDETVSRDILLRMLDTTKTIKRPVPAEFYELAQSQRKVRGQTRSVCVQVHFVYRGISHGGCFRNPGQIVTVVAPFAGRSEPDDGLRIQAIEQCKKHLSDHGLSPFEYEAYADDFVAAMKRKSEIIAESRAAGFYKPSVNYARTA